MGYLKYFPAQLQSYIEGFYGKAFIGFIAEG